MLVYSSELLRENLYTKFSRKLIGAVEDNYEDQLDRTKRIQKLLDKEDNTPVQKKDCQTKMFKYWTHAEKTVVWLSCFARKNGTANTMKTHSRTMWMDDIYQWINKLTYGDVKRLAEERDDTVYTS